MCVLIQFMSKLVCDCTLSGLDHFVFFRAAFFFFFLNKDIAMSRSED